MRHPEAPVPAIGDSKSGNYKAGRRCGAGKIL